eukprot:c47150_g1_i1.p1 GENE.c47150_g1_i1~~c47150_g1_i1.p1  ORF type:complete len:302 (+),score=49.58 c47150_g1_i1:40-906(+)
MVSAAKHPSPSGNQYLIASGISAAINFPLWRASAIAQSGMTDKLIPKGLCSRLPFNLGRVCELYAHSFMPPYMGLGYVLFGMTWARAGIFFGSDLGKKSLQNAGFNQGVCSVLPPLFMSVFVQVVNQPIVRGSIMVQMPGNHYTSMLHALADVRKRTGWGGLWLGTNAGILKAAPKYCVAVILKDYLEENLPVVADTDPHYKHLVRSAEKSVIASVAGAAVTNPFDVLRNEMFKLDQKIMPTLRSLYAEEKFRWFWRGMDKNLIAVAFPIGCTIFFADVLARAVEWGY